jgi:2-polyprenyl-3-methyl-5-hydroxy-6-metoxy-1,4-benzoquinol methylase
MNSRQRLDSTTQNSTIRNLRQRVSMYPDDRLVAFLSRSFGKDVPCKNYKALDIGFGGGRHLKLLDNFGFETYGIEYVQPAIDTVLSNIDHYNSKPSLFKGDYRDFQFDTKFDVIIAWGVLPHSSFSSIENDLFSIKSLLNPRGSIFLNFRTKDNWFYALGKQVDHDTYVLDERAGVYQGYCYSFVNLNEIVSATGNVGLKITHIERVDLWKNDLKEQNSWLICELKLDGSEE